MHFNDVFYIQTTCISICTSNAAHTCMHTLCYFSLRENVFVAAFFLSRFFFFDTNYAYCTYKRVTRNNSCLNIISYIFFIPFNFKLLLLLQPMALPWNSTNFKQLQREMHWQNLVLKINSIRFKITHWNVLSNRPTRSNQTQWTNFFFETVATGLIYCLHVHSLDKLCLFTKKEVTIGKKNWIKKIKILPNCQTSEWNIYRR